MFEHCPAVVITVRPEIHLNGKNRRLLIFFCPSPSDAFSVYNTYTYDIYVKYESTVITTVRPKPENIANALQAEEKRDGFRALKNNNNDIINQKCGCLTGPSHVGFCQIFESRTSSSSSSEARTVRNDENNNIQTWKKKKKKHVRGTWPEESLVSI